jgi:hypothetical protein
MAKKELLLDLRTAKIDTVHFNLQSITVLSAKHEKLGQIEWDITRKSYVFQSLDHWALLASDLLQIAAALERFTKERSHGS